MDSKLSKDGAAWAKTTRKCIQQKISDKVLMQQGANFSCDDVSTTFFDEHIDCYLNGGTISFCSLSPSDKVAIVSHGASIFFSDRIWKVGATGGKLLIACSRHQLFADIISSSTGLWSNLELQIKKQVTLRGWDYASQSNPFASYHHELHHHHGLQEHHRRVSEDRAVNMQLGIFGTEVSNLLVTTESVMEAMLAAVKGVEVPTDSFLHYNGVSLI